MTRQRSKKLGNRLFVIKERFHSNKWKAYQFMINFKQVSRQQFVAQAKTA